MVARKTDAKPVTKNGVWSEWWLILALLLVGLAMIGAGLLVFQGESWLLGLGTVVIGFAFYGVVQELLGAIIGLFENGSKVFFSIIIILFFISLLAIGYWQLNSP